MRLLSVTLYKFIYIHAYYRKIWEPLKYVTCVRTVGTGEGRARVAGGTDGYRKGGGGGGQGR